MLANSADCPTTESTWQAEFETMLPALRRRLRGSFRFLSSEAREDALAEAVVHCLFGYIRLHAQGRAHVATAASLAFYAARQVKCGRPAAGGLNSRDVLSRYAQLRHGIEVERGAGAWIGELVTDPRSSVSDQVAAKLDVGAWWRTLSQRVRQIARDLALGGTTSEVAARHGVSASRISQLRRSLAESWASYQREPAVAAT